MISLKLIGAILLTSSLMFLQGCATEETSLKLDEKVNKEPATLSRSEVHQEVTKWIAESTVLGPDLKVELISIRDSAVSTDLALRDTSLKLRSVLIKDILSADYDPKEIEIVEKRLRSVEKRRLSAFFGTIRKVNTTLGRWASRNERESEEFYDDMMREMASPGFPY